MTALADQIDALDSGLFTFVEAQTFEWDRRALLALHAAAADHCGSFAYLEIGSYLGGSLQVVMRDPRCQHVMSIDPRPVTVADDRREIPTYEGNTTDHMRELLSAIPDVDMDKLVTFEATSDTMSVSDLPARPTYCLVDGEHTHDAVYRDARFCAEAMGGVGVIAFHDYVTVGPAISSFLRENWREVSFALAFSGPRDPSTGGGVFALELGDRGLLEHRAVARAVGSRWHSTLWNIANRPRRSALPFLMTWAATPAIDNFLVHLRHGIREYVRA